MNPRQVAETILGSSSIHSVATTLERAIVSVLTSSGVDRFDAAVDAERLSGAVSRILSAVPPTELPFDLLEGGRIVGKSRSRPGDSTEVASIRRRLQLLAQVRRTAYDLGPVIFERLVAALLLDAGASFASVTARSHEGGIDIYGRIPLRVSDPAIPSGLISSVLVEKSMFVLAQAKCYAPDSVIERGEIDKFAAQASACMDQYAGNPNPPLRKVPGDVYRRNEAALRIVATTASFSVFARGAAESFDVQLIDGRRIAELLTYHGRGFLTVGSETEVSADALKAWVDHRVQASAK